MKKIALIYNSRPSLSEPSAPDDLFEEYDRPETIEAILAALRRLGLQAVPVLSDRHLPRRLEDGGFDFAFNIAEGAGRRCREALAAAVCELLGVPCTGSDALTLAATQDKAVARRIVSPEVPVAAAVLVEENVTDLATLAALSFPVIAKPNDEGSSKGIVAGALCESVGQAIERCNWLHSRYGCPVLVEEYLPGCEVTVGIRGNGADRSILGMMEIAPSEPGAPFIYGLAEKREWRHRVSYHVPPRLSSDVQARIGKLALEACRLLRCNDIARIDFRLDAKGAPVFLECNPLPGLDPEAGDIVLLSRATTRYDALVQGILLDAARRLNITLV